METLTRTTIFDQVPEKDTLLLADALLFSVYGWEPTKVKKMKLISIKRWCELAKKRMTWGDAYKLRRIMEAPKQSLWNKIISKIKS